MAGGKVMPLATAVERLVRPGAHLHLAYGGGRPNAAVAEIARQFAGTRPGFTVSAHGFVNTQHALVEMNLVDRLIVAFAGENHPSPRPNPALRRALRQGTVRIDNWSIWSLTARLMAGALGVPFLPVRSLDGSSMAVDNLGNGYQRVVLGPDGHSSPVVTALRPDLVLVQALAADQSGNVILAPPYGEGAWGALAATDGVIACVETLVHDDVIRAHNTVPMIPAHAVRAVCQVPMGSHPYGMSNGGLPGVDGHVEDAEHMAEFRRHARDPVACREWIDTWILRTRDHRGYLDQLGSERTAALTVRPAEVTSGPRAPGARADSRPTATATAEERMILAAARVIGERVTSAGHDIVLAGIGYAHLAAWSVVPQLQRAGVAVELATELGMLGFVPQAGDPYLFASRNFPSCRQLTDVMSVLGRDVSGPGASSLGVLGAGQIDQAGNLNSTYAENGDFLVGSGGANDVASAADDVVAVVRHSPRRLVESLPYVTAPGHNVSVIVTSAAVLERRDGHFVATRYLAGANDRDEVVRTLTQSTGWDLEIAPECAPEPPPTDEELAMLRGLDPERVFLGTTSSLPAVRVPAGGDTGGDRHVV